MFFFLVRLLHGTVPLHVQCHVQEALPIRFGSLPARFGIKSHHANLSLVLVLQLHIMLLLLPGDGSGHAHAHVHSQLHALDRLVRCRLHVQLCRPVRCRLLLAPLLALQVWRVHSLLILVRVQPGSIVCRLVPRNGNEDLSLHGPRFFQRIEFSALFLI